MILRHLFQRISVRSRRYSPPPPLVTRSWAASPPLFPIPRLFTSFERHTPLVRVLDPVGAVFEPVLERSGIHWLALDDATRREVALQVLAQIPVLWIWDNVEPVTGFPSGSDSAWSKAEQEELAAFLRAARETKVPPLFATSKRRSVGTVAAWS